MSQTGSATRHEVLGIVAAAATVLLALSLSSYDLRGGENWVGPVGESIAGFFVSAFGLGAVWLPIEFVVATALLFRLRANAAWVSHAASTLVILLVGCAFVHLCFGDLRVFGGHLAGGVIGEILAEVMRSLFGTAGAYVICISMLLITVVLRTSLSIVALSSRMALSLGDTGRAVGRSTLDGLRALGQAWCEAREIEQRERAHAEAKSQPKITARPGTAAAKRAARKATSADSEVDADAPVEEDDGVDATVDVDDLQLEDEAVAKRGRRKPSKPSAGGPVIVAPSPEAVRLPPKSVGEPEGPSGGEQSFEPPPVELLTRPLDIGLRIDEETLRHNAERLVDKLAAYGVNGRVDEIHPGPVVTMYEFEPQSGTKVSKIAGLADDLAMALAAEKVRIVAPIPGKARVGFELPNRKRQTVVLRELLEDERWAKQAGPLPVAFGKDIAGKPVYSDLSKMPHLLVAGATGSGKSVGLNVMLTSLLMKKGPQDVRLLMIDPKVVELAVFDGIPHMLLPVVTDMKKASLALRWAVDEMERRYQLFADVGARNVTTYNAKVDRVIGGELSMEQFMPKRVGKMRAQRPDGSEELLPPVDGEVPDALDFTPERLPSIVLVVDEFADLMMVAAKDVETAIARLAQKARAAGIHVILATQRPSVDVITGMIKANFPSRIAFKVSQREDSKTILGRNGAEHLLGLGDMLTLMPGSGELKRVHSAYISEDEVKAVCDSLREQGDPVYDEDILKPRDDEDEAGGIGGQSDDPLYDRAIAIVAQAGYCSISHIQRNLSIGYNKAAKLVERMEKEGVVGPANGKAGGRREVFVEAR